MKSYYEVIEKRKTNYKDLVWYKGFDFSKAKREFDTALFFSDVTTKSVVIVDYKLDDEKFNLNYEQEVETALQYCNDFCEIKEK